MTYQVSQCFTWSKWIKQMNQHGLDGCLMLQISLIKASSANDSTGSIPNLIHPWSVWLSNLSIIINQITNWKSTISQLLMMDGSINQSTRRSIPISQSPNAPQPEAAPMPWGLAVTAAKRSLVKGRRSTCRSMKPSALDIHKLWTRSLKKSR